MQLIKLKLLNIKAISPPIYNDNLQENTFTIKESYKIDSLWKSTEEEKNHITASFIPSSLLNLLYIPNKEERNNDLELMYPSTKEHRIKINLPTKHWDIKNEHQNIISPWLYYDLEVNYDNRNGVIDINHLLKIQKNTVTKKEYKRYTKDVNKLYKSIGYYLTVPESYSSISNSPSFINGSDIKQGFKTIIKYTAILISVIVISLFLYWLKNKDKD